jgi:nucleoside-diphosphate-sugar epimerase
MILVTGATGFVGRAVVARAVRDAIAVRAAVRQAAAAPIPGVEQIRVGNLASDTDWSAATAGIETVIHCAARVHMMQEQSDDPLTQYRRVNVEGTLRLARQAAAAGTRRFVFVSSIKVNGEGTPPGSPYTASDSPAPVDAYGVSKREAEDALAELGRTTGMEIVVVRPVLVYGPGVKANFLAMMRWLRKGVPLPFGAIDNRRSLVALDNLVDLLLLCARHEHAANRTFLVSDGEDVSTADLLRRLAAAMETRARLIPVPPALLRAGATMVGRGDLARRLLGSLQVDISPTRRLLGWSPPVSLDEGLRRTARVAE